MAKRYKSKIILFTSFTNSLSNESSSLDPFISRFVVYVCLALLISYHLERRCLPLKYKRDDLGDGPLFFWRGGGGGGGGGMKNIETNCLQGLKRQNKFLANTTCVKKRHFEKKVHKLKEKVCRGTFFIPPPPPFSRKIMVRPL